ncbi:MAG: hypothetical protein E4H10_01775 [Bacteroidia bacterium]|nr:MAG: hypothetical protein E4H10_01775 [Bacteroidia bacterium]
MKNITLKNFALLLAVMFALSSCASMRVAKDPNAQYMGDWEYVVEELPVDIDGTMVLSTVEGVLKVVLVNPMGDLEIEGASIVDGTFKAEFDAQGNLVELGGKFDGDTYNGLLIVQDTEFVMKAKKVK